jgi:methyl-accepting chemotaxis protein
MSQANINKRQIQNVLINRPLQREFTMVMLSIMMTAALGAAAIVHLVLSELTADLPETIARRVLESMLVDVHGQLVIGIILVLFFAVIITGIFGVFFLHRVAGPIYRVQRILNQVGQGELVDVIRIRRKDFFKELVNSVNSVVSLVKNYHKALREADRLFREIGDEGKQGDTRLAQIEAWRREFKNLKKSV